MPRSHIFSSGASQEKQGRQAGQWSRFRRSHSLFSKPSNFEERRLVWGTNLLAETLFANELLGNRFPSGRTGLRCFSCRWFPSSAFRQQKRCPGFPGKEIDWSGVQRKESTDGSCPQLTESSLHCDEVPVPCSHALGTATRR